VHKEITPSWLLVFALLFLCASPEALCPLGVIIKKSDIAKAEVHGGDQGSAHIDAANASLILQGLPPIKAPYH
jgi:hypothetical protein